MNKKDFAMLCMNYNKEPNEELFELWKYNLRPYDEKEIKQAFNIIASNDKFFPNLKRVLEVVKEVVKKEEIDFDSEKAVREKMEKLNIKPFWLDCEIVNEPLDEKSQKEFEDFQDFLKEFKES